ncbi:MAG: hypothetical protein RL417_1574 [Pseudomonadota bacterium]
MCGCLVAIHSPLVAEESVELGVEDFGPGLDVLGDTHPAATILRAGMGEGLLSLRRRSDGRPTKGQFELALADSVNVDSDFSRWSFRVRRGARFHSGRPISAEDVIFSLDRCVSQGKLTGVKKSVSRRDKTPYDALEEWVEIEIESENRGALPKQLADCPIWERDSAHIFGAEFGRGANLVGAGPLRLVGYKPGKQYVLQRTGRSEQAGSGGASVVIVRGFSEPARGLTALREGTLGAFFTSEPGVLAKAAGDETLVIFRCAGYDAVRRRDLTISCDPSLDVARLRAGR